MAEQLWMVFENAAVPQRIVLVSLYASLPGILVFAALALTDKSGIWKRIIAEMRVAGPALGLLAGGLNSYHMGRTILRLPVSPTLKQVAPGIFEVSTLVSLGALVGVVAVIAHLVLCFSPGRATQARS